jgi:DNA-binding PadR family transcriptional regulator
MTDQLNNVSYVAMALIGRGGASPHDLVEMMRSGGNIYYAVAPSKMYAEPKRLEKLGYVKSKKAPGKTRERTFYTLTPKGLAALKRWAVQPSPLPRIQNEAIARLICGDIVGDDAKLLEGLRALGPEIEDQEARLVEARKRLESLPHRERYLLLTDSLGMKLLEAQREWLAEVERELGPDS